jgi:hypothetical protein
VEEQAGGFAALLRGGPTNRTGEVGAIVDSVRQGMFRLVISQIPVAEPGPVLRITLRSWIASVETAALDWLEHRGVDRAELKRLLVAQPAALGKGVVRQGPRVAGTT